MDQRRARERAQRGLDGGVGLGTEMPDATSNALSR
jgi:hypothetical protein